MFPAIFFLGKQIENKKMLRYLLKKTFPFVLLFCSSTLFSLSYEIKFVGLKDKEIILAIKNGTNIFLLKDHPPKTLNSLRYRVESDLPAIVKTFHAFGFFDASVNYDIDEEDNKNISVFIFCNPGPRYLLQQYDICTTPCNTPNLCKKLELDLKKLNLEIGEGIDSKKLLAAKAELLILLAKRGYPLAKMEKYEVIADGIRKTINIKICIDVGPLCNFGPLSIIGLKNIDPKFVMKKVVWKENGLFTSEKIQETQSRLTNTGLFSSVSITHANSLDSEKALPIKIQVIEANHQNVTLGVNYATVDGPGCLFSYTNYNIRHMGEIINLHGEFAKKALTGYISHKKPDFIWLDQDLISAIYAQREMLTAYHSCSYGFSAKVIHKINRRFHYSHGLKGEYVGVSDSANNGTFLLLSLPFYTKYDTSNHLLNPTKGIATTYNITPYLDLNKSSLFVKQNLTSLCYIPIKKNQKIVLASRLQLGSILGQTIYKIPMTKLFLGGNEEDLRGYKYKTVGPRTKQGKILGGRSIICWTVEPRLRISKNIGVVPFCDIGNIQLNATPTIKGKWRKSIGVGFRYFTFLGPIRLDVAFPLNKYKKSDPSYRFYVSIGQTF